MVIQVTLNEALPYLGGALSCKNVTVIKSPTTVMEIETGMCMCKLSMYVYMDGWMIGWTDGWIDVHMCFETRLYYFFFPPPCISRRRKVGYM